MVLRIPRAPLPSGCAAPPRSAQVKPNATLPQLITSPPMPDHVDWVRSRWIVVGSLVVMVTWSIGTGTYFAFHDDVLKRLISRQSDMQFAYEDRIAELRAQVDRITSRQLLDQEQFEQKLEHVFNRQATLESRAATLSVSRFPGSIKCHPRGMPKRALPPLS